MAQGFDRREVIQDRIASTVQSEQGRVPLSPIQTPRPASQKAAGSGYAQIAGLLGAAGGLLDQYIDKKNNEAIIAGELAYAEGKTEEEIRAQGNKHTTAGFMRCGRFARDRSAPAFWLQSPGDTPDNRVFPGSVFRFPTAVSGVRSDGCPVQQDPEVSGRAVA